MLAGPRYSGVAWGADTTRLAGNAKATLEETVSRLPLTFPVDGDAVAVDENGICASPNDVPGYDKEAYMNGRAYVYVDADSNHYRLGHGLFYD